MNGNSERIRRDLCRSAEADKPPLSAVIHGRLPWIVEQDGLHHLLF